MNRSKRWFALCITFCMLVTMLPTVQLTAAASNTDTGSVNALQALGFDTSKIPSDVNLESTDNPFGKSTITQEPVSEIFEQFVSYADLYGHNKALGGSWNDFYTSSSMSDKKITTVVGNYGASAVSAGDFVKAENGNRGQIVTVASSQGGVRSEHGGLYLSFSDPVNDRKSSTITLVDNTQTIGNTGLLKYKNGTIVNENYNVNWDLLQNNLQVVCGDFDGDGIDEVAVYVPEQNNPRVIVYKLEADSSFSDNASTYFLNSSHWVEVWSYNLKDSLWDQRCVPNMISLTAGDFDRDGIDDLSVTWGTFYDFVGLYGCSGSQNIILCGGKGDRMFLNADGTVNSLSLDLTCGGTPIVRASVVLGDIDGDGVNDIIVGGQLLDDKMETGHFSYTRFVAVYTYTGAGFTQTLAKNFDLFAKTKDSSGNETYVYSAMANHTWDDGVDRFYSQATMKADVTVVNMEGAGKPSDIYLDSLIVKYGDDGLDILTSLDNNTSFNIRAGNSMLGARYYTEYGVVAADLTGGAKQSLQVRLNYLHEAGDCPETVDVKAQGVLTPQMDSNGNVKSYSFSVNTLTNTFIDFASSFCELNTDNDTSYFQYLDVHGIKYSDPKVIAVLASPPYFKDLARDDLSKDYMSSSTEYETATGSGSESSHAYTIKAGVYISFETSHEIFAVETKKEFEVAVEGAFTKETSDMSETESAVSFETDAGQDTVAFYSIPTEYYYYADYVPQIDTSGNVTGYEKQLMMVNIPHTAATVSMPLERYEKIAENYPDLPEIAGKALTHTVGEPSTYPSSTSGYNKVLVCGKDFAGVGYGEASTGQSIVMSDESNTRTEWSESIEFKIGAGVSVGKANKIAVSGGITAGLEYAKGTVTIDTSSTTYSAKIHDMPEAAEAYGYYFAWKLFTYTYQAGGYTIPVVDYLVTDVTAPPSLPNDFAQSYDLTTTNSIGLTWSYPSDTPVAAFALYRYYDFPEGGGSQQFTLVPASDVKYTDTNENGKTVRHYQYIDDGLGANTDTIYQIQAVRSYVPIYSILSGKLTATTKPDKGNPTIALNGVFSSPGENYLQVYPDMSSTVSVSVAEEYMYGPFYQWQKLNGSGVWEDITDATSSTYTFSKVGIDAESKYRCRVNVVYYDQTLEKTTAITAYSDFFTLRYAKRVAKVADSGFSVDSASGTVSLALESTQSGHTFAPSGDVTFFIKGDDYASSVQVPLGDPDTNYIATATLDLRSPEIGGLNLPEGIYEITAYYAGSTAYGSLEVPGAVYYSSGNADGYFLDVDSTFTYGDSLQPTLTHVSGNSGKIICEQLTDGVSYKVFNKQRVDEKHTVVIGQRIVSVIPFVEETVYYTYYVTVYKDVEVPGFLGDDGTVTARASGSYTLKAYINGTEAATKAITVNPRTITIGFSNPITGVAGSDAVGQPTYKNLVVKYGNLCYDDTLENLGLIVHAYNNANTEITIGLDTEAGAYTLCPGPAETTSTDYGNYTIRLETGTYTLTGPKYGITLVSKQYGADGIVGTAKVVSPVVANDDGTTVNLSTTAVNETVYQPEVFTNGTTIILTASPQKGYQVKSWTVQAGGKIMMETTSSTTCTYQMTADDTTVTVAYKMGNKLYFQSANSKVNDGTVTLLGGNGSVISSGNFVLPGVKYSFLATPANGYHFVEWTLSGSTNSNFQGDYDEQTGTSKTTVTMGDTATTLSAVFARNDYNLTLQNNLQVTYSIDDGAGNMVKKTGTGVVTITGGTQVTITPQTGYSLQDDATWLVNGSAVENVGNSYTFTLDADTTISVGTVQNSFTVSTSVTQPDGAEHNAVYTTVNGSAADLSQAHNIPGGTELSFTARSAWGYAFDHWEINGVAAGTDGTLNVAALGNSMQVVAVFKDNPNRFTFHLSNNSGGTLSYTVLYNETGYSGNAPLDAVSSASGTDVTVYKGDSILVTAQPDKYHVLRHWVEGENVIHDNTDEMLKIDSVSGNMNVVASFAYQNYAEVNYFSENGGTIPSATTDGFAFDSGDTVGIGSKVVIIAQPSNGMVVDHWTLNGEIVNNSDNTMIAGDSLTIGNLNTAADVKVFFTASSLVEGETPDSGVGSSSGSVNIGYDFSKCTLPSEVKAAYIEASTLQQGSADFNVAKELIENHETSDTINNLIIYNLKLLDQNHNAITGFSATVTVRIPIPKGMSGDLHIYWYDDTKGMVTDMNAKQENGYLVFDTTHFSYYAVAELAERSSGSSSTGASDQTSSSGDSSSSFSGTVLNPDTGDDSIPFISAVLLGIAACVAVAVVSGRRRHKKN